MAGHRILIADDHPLTREGLTLAARSALNGSTIDVAGTIAEAEAMAAARAGFYLVLLDLMLPDTRGFSGLLRLQFAMPLVPIVVITAREEPTLAGIARELGAKGFLLKSAPLDELARALRDVAAGIPVFPATNTTGAAAPVRDRIAQLSDAQRRVLFALADGRLNKQIAHDLDITEATVKAHLTAIFRRLGVANRTQAILALQPLLGDPGA